MATESDSHRDDMRGTADRLRPHIRAARRRLAGVTMTFVLAAGVLFALVEVVNNSKQTVSDAIANIASASSSDRAAKTHQWHFIVHHGLPHRSDLFVVSTAMLAVVAAINIGVAVMPPAKPLQALKGAEMEARARAIVWNQSLSSGSYFAALICSFCAVASWVQGKVTQVWIASTTLSVIALLAVFIAANVAALAVDEADRLLTLHDQLAVIHDISEGLRQVDDRWASPWASKTRLRWRNLGLMGASALVFYLCNVATMLLIAVLYVPHWSELFAKDNGFAVIFGFGLVYAILGLYFFVVALLFAKVKGFASQVSHAYFTKVDRPAGVWPRLRPTVGTSLQVFAIAALTAIAITTGVETNEPIIGIFLALTWVWLPESLIVWGWRSGRGPFAYFFSLSARRRFREANRLRSKSKELKRLLGMSDVLPVEAGWTWSEGNPYP